MEIPEGEGWVLNVGVEPAYRGKIDILFRNGKYIQEHELGPRGPRVYRWRWELLGLDWDIIKWRPKDAE